MAAALAVGDPGPIRLLLELAGSEGRLGGGTVAGEKRWLWIDRQHLVTALKVVCFFLRLLTCCPR